MAMFYIEQIAGPIVSTAVSAVLFTVLVFTSRAVTVKDLNEFV
jgi:hypothetical protein